MKRLGQDLFLLPVHPCVMFCLCPYVIPEQVNQSGNYQNLIYWLSRPSSLLARLPVDEPALAWIVIVRI